MKLLFVCGLAESRPDVEAPSEYPPGRAEILFSSLWKREHPILQGSQEEATAVRCASREKNVF